VGGRRETPWEGGPKEARQRGCTTAGLLWKVRNCHCSKERGGPLLPDESEGGKSSCQLDQREVRCPADRV
jgi:hypothetical protein